MRISRNNFFTTYYKFVTNTFFKLWDKVDLREYFRREENGN